MEMQASAPEMWSFPTRFTVALRHFEYASVPLCWYSSSQVSQAVGVVGVVILVVLWWLLLWREPEGQKGGFRMT